MIKGVLEFHSETGTEGGWFAFQDERFMHLPPPNQWWCKQCYRIWDQDRQPDEPVAELRDPSLQSHPSSTRRYDELMNIRRQLCIDYGHLWVSPEEQHPDGVWSYEGLHMLHSGDHLTVFDKTDHSVVFSGEVRLTQRDDVYTNPDATVFGLWVNQEPDVGVDRLTWARWFLGNWPCEVEPTCTE